MLPTIVVTVLLLTIAAVTLNGYVQDPHRDRAVASMAGTALTRTSFNTLATESAASAGIGASPETVSSASGASIEADKNFICEETWGIFPCSSHAIGSIVLMLVYGTLLLVAAKCISDGSELLLEILDPGIIGGLVLPVLGALPDSMIIVVSGIGGTVAQAQEQVSVGVGTLAGSTIMLLTIAWGACAILARCDIDWKKGDGGRAKDKKLTNTFDLFDSGFTVEANTKGSATIMCATALLYFIIQVPAFVNDTLDRVFALVGMIACIAALIAYCVYQVVSPDLQKDKMEAAKDRVEKQRKMQALQSFALKQAVKQLPKGFQEFVGKDGKLDKQGEAALGDYFQKFDLDKSGCIDFSTELPAALTTLQIPVTEENLKIFMALDTGGDGQIDKTEFVTGFKNWLEDSTAPEQTDVQPEAEEEEEEEEEGDDDEELAHMTEEQRRAHTIKWAAIYLFAGIAMAAVFSDPMVDSITTFSKSTGLSAFLVSFVITPFASNASELVSSLIQASKRSRKNITLTVAQIYGAVTMNNTMCLGIFLALVNIRGLLWTFSAEVFSILTVTWIVGAVAATRVTFPLWMAPAALALYPLSLVMYFYLDKFSDGRF